MVVHTLRPLIGSVVFIEPERSKISTTRVSRRVAVALAPTIE